MSLDLRLPIGLMFAILGTMLTAFGLVSGDAIYNRSFGINVNLWWGPVVLAFGLVLLALAIRAERKRHSEREPAP